MDFVELYLTQHFKPEIVSETDLSFLRNVEERIKRKLIVKDGSGYDKIYCDIGLACVLDELAETLPNSTVLDIGCGSIKDGLYLISNHNIAEYVGIGENIESVWLRIMVEKGYNPRRSETDLYERPTYDVIPKLKVVDADFRAVEPVRKYDVCLNVGVTSIAEAESKDDLDKLVSHVKSRGRLIYSGNLLALADETRELIAHPNISDITEYWVKHENMANSGSNLVSIFQVCTIR